MTETDTLPCQLAAAGGSAEPDMILATAIKARIRGLPAAQLSKHEAIDRNS